MNDLFDDNGAFFSDDRKYRYALWRIWDKSKPLVMFIGLNPSTANENTDDPTIRRIIRFAHSWGYGGVYMMNLFALVTSHPEELKLCKDPLGDNNKWLDEISSKCTRIVFAWGAFPEAKQRALDIITSCLLSSLLKDFPEVLALDINKDGSPKHPLYIRGDVKPIKYNLTNN